MKVPPGGMGHCVTPDGPSIALVPVWNIPWKCREVVSFPSLLLRLTITLSPMVACSHEYKWNKRERIWDLTSIGGQGN